MEEKPTPPRCRFAVYYGTEDDELLKTYEVLVLDSDIAPDIVHKYRRNLVLGYLSLGEVHTGRRYARELDQEGLLLSENRNWRDARFIDLRHPGWKQRVLHQLVPQLLERGFRGVFLDTLDDAHFLETDDPSRHAGMLDAAADLVHGIRQRFPRVPLMVNRAYALLPRIVGDIDMLLGESVRATYDSGQGRYVRVAEADVRWQLDRMHEARRRNPALRLFSLDYWEPDDTQGIARLYAEQRAEGFSPYVATFDLNRLVPQP
ncbi:endo alpha-1,4 polygalactosaminidase [Caldimonas tepidiphila]|uniref:endo alpha-1,4 polygalactosaminidase n=1 Tax=Caldimonas tepidiphila TaxID=2315841 RepID=UPI0013006960|nr:endo alpha-1,4 polygalactosaminidase [Caldimonas tepidiphila]